MKGESTQSLHELLNGVRDGDRTCFTLLMESTSERVYQLFRHAAGATQADDLMQEFWIKIWRHRKSYRSVRGTWRWLHRIATNLLLDHLKSASVRHQPLGLDEWTHPVAHLVMECDRDKMTAACFQALAPVQKVVFYLSVVEGYSPVEAADLVGMNRSTFRNHLASVRRKLRLVLVQAFPEYF